MKYINELLHSKVESEYLVDKKHDAWHWAMPLGPYETLLTDFFGVPCKGFVPRVAPVKQSPFAAIKNIVAIGAGKGGVGKTTITMHLARGLQAMGARVGVLDADIYGPNIMDVFNIDHQQAAIKDQRYLPILSDGIPTMSLSYLLDEHQPVLWRGPMLHKALAQMLWHTQWGALDYLLIDLPPGTGDVWMTLSQKAPLSASLLVTTEQRLALKDTIKAQAAYEHLGIPVLGAIFNMTHTFCHNCSKKQEIYPCDSALLNQIKHHLYRMPLGELSSFETPLAIEFLVSMAALPRWNKPILPSLVVE
ncbi:MAG: P-loop NTPase [Candidatus Comchoanobacterales bacterium]